MNNLRITRLASAGKVKHVETPSGVYVLGVDLPQEYQTFDADKRIFLKGIFRSEAFEIEGTYHNPAVNDAYSYDIGTRGPRGRYSHVVQYENFAVGLKGESVCGPYSYNYRTERWEMDLELVPVYQKPEGTYDDTYFDSLSSPRAWLSGLPFAHMSEIPLDAVLNDYDSGTMYADTISLKNPYDENWDVSLSETPATSGPVIMLNNSRTYQRIGVNGSDVWMSYRANSNWQTSDSDGVPSGELEQIARIEETTPSTGVLSGFEFIEKVKGYNRAESTSRHKSNLFSIQIRNSNLNEAIEDEQLRSDIQTVIEKAIWELIYKVAPAYTQLWKIEWLGR